mmetsp:Transcript_107003/g.184564  ORF Transcript_107003/g.184564 Transcript_107003/m.184564 type:complete len:216 (-) Transcript_107003:241-888(-)
MQCTVYPMDGRNMLSTASQSAECSTSDNQEVVGTDDEYESESESEHEFESDFVSESDFLSDSESESETESLKVHSARFVEDSETEEKLPAGVTKWKVEELVPGGLDDLELKCQICWGLLMKPHILCKEGHTACRVCLERLCKRECFICREPILGQLVPNRHAELFVWKLQVQCPAQDRGCKWIGQLEHLKDHHGTCCLLSQELELELEPDPMELD